MLMQFIESAG